MRNVYKLLVSEPEGKKPCGRPRQRWKDNIIMDLREVRICGLDWSGWGQRPVAGSCEHRNEPSGSL